MSQPSAEITRLARRWSAGDRSAFDALIEHVYPELRILARSQLRGRRGTVSTTVLVHEAYLKLAGVQGAQWRSRVHFYAFCAEVMRHILVDAARRRSAARRGGDRRRVTLEDHAAVVDGRALEVLAVHEALERLAEHNERMARIVVCRCFGGMSMAETATALETPLRTVEREWARGRAYLRHAMGTSAG